MSSDNSDLPGKLLLRQAALDAVAGGGAQARVLDCFAGEGHMFEKVWKGAQSYLGLERRFARPPGHPRGECWRGDNRMLLGRALAREPWNVVDLDAYGSPWQLFKRVVRGASASRLVVTLTCGLSRNLCSDRPTAWVGELTGVKGLSYSGMLVRFYDDVARWTIAYCLAGTEYQAVRVRRAVSRRNINTWYWLVELVRQ